MPWLDILLFLGGIVLTTIIIWRASAAFETASEYIGRDLTDGVRGATINAIASSIPELLTTIFFLVYLGQVEGFASGIGTTAGSAIFNSMIIPAAVILVVLGFKVTDTIQISRKVFLRDGIVLLACEVLLILVISQNQLYWWHGAILMVAYLAYFFWMLRNKLWRKGHPEETSEEETEEETTPVNRFRSLIKLNLTEVVLGNKSINSRRAWLLLTLSTIFIAVACFGLVYACEVLAETIGVKIYFIAVIIAAAATSVPDTVISIRDGFRGNYDDAISNALGSNIFDICFALGFPLFIYTLVYQPIDMSGTGGEVTQLRMILLILTAITLLIYITGRKLTRFKAILLILLYLVFVLYIVGISMEPSWGWADTLSNQLQLFVSWIEDFL